MAQGINEKELDEIVHDDAEKLFQKRVLTNDPEWEPIGGDHGPGIMPEELWRQEHPDSKPETSLQTEGEIE